MTTAGRRGICSSLRSILSKAAASSPFSSKLTAYSSSTRSEWSARCQWRQCSMYDGPLAGTAPQ
eukprot:6200201-Pleurochrysis_carterae.AAC.1